MELLNLLNINYMQLILVLVAAFLIGFSKTGISGVSMISIPILAAVFGGKESTGVVLPILIAADIFAITFYRRHVEWSNIKRVLPWALAGLAIGVLVGNLINDKQFKILISVTVLICLALLIYMEKKGEAVKVPEKAWFYIMTGVVVGFASMIGNAAGPIFSVYLLALGFKKNDFIGTSAWFFFIINLTKLPLQVFFWKNIHIDNLIFVGLGLIPIALGAFAGYFFVKKINEKPFRYIVIVMIALACVRLFV